MGICRECKLVCRESGKRPWVFLIVLFLATFSSFLTWLALDSTGIPTESNNWWSGVTFLAVTIVLISYYFYVLRRYCAHHRQHGEYND